jgi:glycosyltransferase involved in cell wall biosynthesis
VSLSYPTSRRPASVTICVPVYNNRAFVAETLEAVQRQRYEHLTVLVSDDASDDGSAEVCRGFTSDPRFRVEAQPARLGWVENCNWLLAHAPDDLVCIVSHDDLPEPDHVGRLVRVMEDAPDCAMAFSDVRIFGLLDHVEHQDAIFGSPTSRLRAFIARHFDGTAFHGVVRRRALEVAGGLRRNALDDFAADVGWLARVAWAGDLLRVSEPLYRKRRHNESTSLTWGRWDAETRVEAWTVHCRELLRDALDRPMSAPDRQRVVSAIVRRLLAIEPVLPFSFIRTLPRPRRLQMVDALLDGERLDDAEALSVRALAELAIAR